MSHKCNRRVGEIYQKEQSFNQGLRLELDMWAVGSVGPRGTPRSLDDGGNGHDIVRLVNLTDTKMGISRDSR